MREPLIIRLTSRAVSRADGLKHLVRARIGSTDPAVESAFFFKNDERSFARAVLDRLTHLWLFRTHQRRFAGDFIAVDMSGRETLPRRVYALDLKRGAELRVGGGGASNQFVGLDAALGAVTLEVGELREAVRLTGDASMVVEYLERQVSA